MNILGINQVSGLLTWQHDGAAALIKDGSLIATAEEERFNRQRHAKGFPRQAINYCLTEGEITIADVDIIAVGYDPNAFLRRGFFMMNLRAMFSYFASIVLYHMQVKELAKKAKSSVRVIYVPHHRAHAATAYRCSAMEEANVLTIDGSGETECASLFEARGGDMKLLASIPIALPFDKRTWRSIGNTYSSLTSFLKLGAHGEGKTMGLASWGEPRFDFSKILSVESFSKWHIDRRNIAAIYGQYERREGEPLNQDHKDLAASLQKALEDAVVNLARDAYERTGIRNFALAGGCALNCNANSRLLAEDFCDSIFVQPASHDGGIALGAALEAMHEAGDGEHIEFINAYWGPGYSDEQIEKALKEAKVQYRRSDDIAGETAKIIASGKIVAWFQGRMEMGPRALGNRSILGNPQIEGMNDRINEDVKHREVWRPFAPSLAAHAATKYFEKVEKAQESPFMLLTFYVKPEFRKVFPAITHVDGSSRIQTVTKEQNPRYFELLEAMERETGHPMVLNTSFNDAGEPIICSPKDALRCFYGTGIDVLAIGSFLLEK